MINNFPFEKFMGYQKKILKTIEKTFKDKKIIVLEAPTGSGKSPIALAVAKYFKNAYIVTSQKLLQDQYVNNFNLVELKGKSNYMCGMRPIPANLAKCKGCFYPCQYRKALNDAIKSDITILNYHVALMQHRINEEPRNILICDECHNIEDVFMSMVEFKINLEKLASMKIKTSIPDTNDMEKLKKWLNGDLLVQIEKELNILEEKDSDSQDDLMKIDYLSNLYSKISNFLISSEKWVYCDNEKSFKPLKIKSFTKRLFEMSKNKILLMSATVLNPDSFLESIGLNDRSDVAYIPVPSTFPKENRKISLAYCNVNLKYTNLKQGIKDLNSNIEKILNKHIGEKGVIHTTNYNIAKNIQDNFFLEDRLLFPTPKTRFITLDQHINSKKDTVLVSPSMTEGVDLKDDLSRFQIICKIPYPFLGDKQITERKKIDPDWYIWKTCISLVQSYGRSIRSESDHAKTYILDESFKWFVKINAHMLPKWFFEAIEY